MAEDLRFGLQELESKDATTKTVKQVESSYETFRSSDNVEFGSQDGFALDMGVDDFWGI